MATRRVSTTVAVIQSLSYTGTTWLNALIGAHPGAVAVGPPDRVYKMRREGLANACLVHGSECAFWPAFEHEIGKPGTFIRSLGEFADRDVVAINNPSAEFARSELRDPRLRLRRIQLVRDGRAVAVSYLRHHPGATFLEAVQEFLLPSFEQFYFDEDDPDVLCLRYEDLAERPRTVLPRVFDFLDLPDCPEALRFWESPQHLTTGNVGVIAVLRYAEGLHMGSFTGEEFYRKEFARLQNDPIPRLDDRWHEEITGMDRFLFDLLCGQCNAKFGYRRDRFSLPESEEFRRAIGSAIAAGALEQEQVNALQTAAGKVGMSLATVPPVDPRTNSETARSASADAPPGTGRVRLQARLTDGYILAHELAIRAWRAIKRRGSV